MLCCRKAARALNGESQPVIPFYGRPAYDFRQDLRNLTCCGVYIRWTFVFHRIFAQE